MDTISSRVISGKDMIPAKQLRTQAEPSIPTST